MFHLFSLTDTAVVAFRLSQILICPLYLLTAQILDYSFWFIHISIESIHSIVHLPLVFSYCSTIPRFSVFTTVPHWSRIRVRNFLCKNILLYRWFFFFFMTCVRRSSSVAVSWMIHLPCMVLYFLTTMYCFSCVCMWVYVRDPAQQYSA